MPAFLRTRWLFNLIPRTFSYFFSDLVPIYYKLVMLLPVLWLFTPISRLTNGLGIAGFIDEFTIWLAAMALFVWLVEGYINKQAAKKADEVPLIVIEGEVIDPALSRARQPENTQSS